MNIEQQIRDLQDRVKLLEQYDLDLKGRRIKNAGRALAGSDLCTLGQARDLISSPEVQKIIEQQVSYIEGGPFGVPVSIGDTNALGGSGQYADAYHVHASNLTTKGDLLGFSTTTTRHAVGTNGESLYANSAGTTGVSWGSGWKGARVKTLTDNTLTGLFEVALTTLTICGGVVHYLVRAADAADAQAEAGVVSFAAVNKAGAITVDVDKIGSSQPVSAGTLSVTFAVASGADKVTFQVTVDTSLTPTTLDIRYFLDEGSPQVVTFL